MIERYQTQEMKALFSESRRFDFMLTVEKAVAQVQGQFKIIPKAAAQDILNKSKIDYKKILKIEQTTKHDVIAFVQQVSESVGTQGKYFHHGLTSSDVLDTALSLQMGEAFEILLQDIKSLKKMLLQISKKHEKTICPGRTHGIFAEITTFGFKMRGFLSEVSRAEARVVAAKNQFKICKLSGAVGTSSALGIEVEKKVAQLLKLNVEPFSTQVIPRDRHAEVFTSLAFMASALERLAIELRHLQRTEVSEVIEGFDPGQKGSSAMPHKKNPISAENITGLSRLIKSFSNVAMDNILLWHERDISHSSNERIIFQEAFTLSHYSVNRMIQLLANLYIDAEQMKRNTFSANGKLYSSAVLNHLVTKGMDRQEAYSVVQKLCFELQPGESLELAIKNEPSINKYFSKADYKKIFSGESVIKSIQKRIKVYGQKV